MRLGELETSEAGFTEALSIVKKTLTGKDTSAMVIPELPSRAEVDLALKEFRQFSDNVQQMDVRVGRTVSQ